MKPLTNQELNLIKKASSEFAGKILAKAIEVAGSDHFSPEYEKAVKKAYELDFFHLTIPESAGGIGAGLRAFCSVLENISIVDTSLAAIILTTVSALEIPVALGMDIYRNENVKEIASVSDFLMAFPLFLDPVEFEVPLTARKKGNGYVLSGNLENLVLGNCANKAVVPALIRNDSNFYYFIVDLTANSTHKKIVKGLGILSCPICDIRFVDSPAELCSSPNGGITDFSLISSKYSVALCAMQNGLMKGALKDALDYTKRRYQGGRPIIHWSEVKKILSDMALNIKLSDMLINQCCSVYENNLSEFDICSASAFIKTCEMACRVTSDGIRVMGGVGYMEDFHQEKRFRDARHLMVAFGPLQAKKIGFLENFVTKSAIYNQKEG